MSEREKHEHLYKVSRIYIHPHYNRKTSDNDIALVRLRDEIQYNDHVRPICLPRARTAFVKGFTVGWGLTIKNNGN